MFCYICFKNISKDKQQKLSTQSPTTIFLHCHQYHTNCIYFWIRLKSVKVKVNCLHCQQFIEKAKQKIFVDKLFEQLEYLQQKENTLYEQADGIQDKWNVLVRMQELQRPIIYQIFDYIHAFVDESQ